MSSVFLMLFVVFCPVILSESGDDGVLDDEDVTCSSNLTLTQSSLTCSLIGEPIEGVKLTLCSETDKIHCANAIQGPPEFTFPNLSTLATYELRIEPWEYVKKKIMLAKLVKIPAPQIKLATYIEEAEESVISIQHNHDFVKRTNFQVEVIREKTDRKMSFNTEHHNITISRDLLDGNGVYNIRVRAKPVGYFDGMWSEWSSRANFTINKSFTAPGRIDPSIKTYIIIIFSVFLVLIICLGILRWRTDIKDYIKPNIPYPKTTFAQIQRGKEGFPFIFSPEIFRDAFIHRVDYVDEKPSAEELQEVDERCYSQASSADSRSTSVCEMDTNAVEPPAEEQSHLKIGLLSESDFPEETEGGSEGVTALQQKCKEEAYVTMSSLFKIQ